MKKVFLFGVQQSMFPQAVAEGLVKLGHIPLHRSLSSYRENNYEPCDAAIAFGLHGGGMTMLKEHREHDVPVLIIDYGYVKRGTLMYSHVDRGLYYSLSLNGLNGRSDPLPGPMQGHRWGTLKTPLQPWHTDGKYILVCGQKNHDVAIGNLNPIIWAKQVIEELQHRTKRPIVFRPHPESPEQKRPIGIPHSEEFTFAEALRDAYAVVAYNSNSLVEATVAGVPTFALGEGSMVENVTNKTLQAIENPKMPDRQQWAYDLAWRQFTIDDFKSGLFWQYAIDHNVPFAKEIARELPMEVPPLTPPAAILSGEDESNKSATIHELKAGETVEDLRVEDQPKRAPGRIRRNTKAIVPDSSLPTVEE